MLEFAASSSCNIQDVHYNIHIRDNLAFKQKIFGMFVPTLYDGGGQAQEFCGSNPQQPKYNGKKISNLPGPNSKSPTCFARLVFSAENNNF